MKGKRVGTARRAGRRLAARPHTRRTVPAKDRRTARLVICGAVFVLIVAVKLLFPQAVSELAQCASRIIGQDADFREAFAAVGRAVSGEETVGDSLQDAYAAVFNPSEMSVSIAGEGIRSTELIRPGEALADLTLAALPAAREETEAQPQTTEAQPQTTETQPQAEEVPEASGGEDAQALTSSTVYMTPSLPENASLEQKNLGFSYTTPVNGKLTSPFGWREHPTEGGTRFHYGIDLAADTGTEIVAFADGEVFATGESSTLGKYIILLHAGGYKTLYAHCSAVLVTGGSVSMGTAIAQVGETGTATGPHLHFELQNGSMYFNPIYYVAVG